MKVAVIYNKMEIDDSDVINLLGMPTKERYNPRVVGKVAAALEKGGHNVRTIEGNMRVIDELQLFMPRVMRGERPGMVFNMAYGIQGQSRYTHIPAMLEMLGVPYVGSGPAGQALALDKVMSKIVFQGRGLPTPPFWLFTGPDEDLSAVEFPCIVKPKMEAVSFGLRRVTSYDDLREAVATITSEFQQPALVEAFVPGREFAVGLMGNGGSLETLPIVEIDLGGDPDAVQSVEEKTQRPRGKICPPDLPGEICQELSRLSRGAFDALGLLDFARVDFRMDPEGGLHILEINSMASLNPTGSFVRAGEVAGLDFDALVNRMLDVAATRYFGESLSSDSRRTVSGGQRRQALPIRVRRYLREHRRAMIENIGQMVAIDSHVRNVQGVNQLGQWVARHLTRLGFARQVYPHTEVGDILYFTNHDEECNDVLLLSHLDTIFSYQDYRPFSEERGRIYGSGAAESKGGIALFLAALQALHFARALRGIRCGVLLTTDDTLGGRYSGNVVGELAGRSAYVLGMKPSDPGGTCAISCSGAQEYEIDLTSRKPAPGKRARDLTADVARRVLAWQKLASSEEGIRVIVNRVSAEANPGRIPDHAAVTITTRFTTPEQGADLDLKIRTIAERGADGRLHVHVRSGARHLPVLETERRRRLFDIVRGVAEQLEIRVEPVHRPIPAGICHVPEEVPALDGFGPAGGDVRSAGEHILRDSLIDRAALLAVVLHACSAREGGASRGQCAEG